MILLFFKYDILYFDDGVYFNFVICLIVDDKLKFVVDCNLRLIF